MPKNAAALRKEALRLLALADAEKDPALRNSFIHLALQNAEMAFEIEQQERMKDSTPPR